MNPEEALFREFLAGLPDEEQRRLGRDTWWLDSWYDWIGVGACSGSYLESGYIDWLERRGDCRGEFLSLWWTLNRDRGLLEEVFGARRGRSRVEEATQDAFLQDILEHPKEETPRLVFADWLEERGDPRAGWLCSLSRLHQLTGRINIEWIEALELTQVQWPASFHWGRVDDRARRVMMLAHQQALRLNHRYVGTQHILRALLRECSGLAYSVLTAHGLRPGSVRRQVEKVAPRGTDFVLMGKLWQSGRTRQAILFAVMEAGDPVHHPMTPEHLLLGICRAGPGVATWVLRDLGVSPGLLCGQVLTGLGRDPGRWLRAHPEVW